MSAPDLPALPAMVRTDRLRLILFTSDDAADMVAGRHQERWHPDYPREDDRDVAAGVRPGAQLDPWGPRHIVLGTLAVGSIGFYGHTPAIPSDASEAAAAEGDLGEIEVGYGLVEAARGQGVATEALLGLLAETDRLGVRVRAGTEPDNRASLRVLAKAGFTDLRGSDEEGRLVMARPLRR